jgi:1,4-dihydroxy-2-naphthoate octaprenyltransferase
MGPKRVTGTLLTPFAVARAMLMALAAAVILGAYLALIGGWPIVLIGGVAVVCAIAYAGGPWPLGHHGLGEVFVFVFFGPVAVAGTAYLMGASLTDPSPWLAGATLGFLSAAILLVNNIRDIPTDARAGKRTLAVRLGEARAWRVFAAFLALAYACPVALAMIDPRVGLAGLLPLLTLPVAALLYRRARAIARGPGLNPMLAKTAQLTLLVGILLAAGVAL